MKRLSLASQLAALFLTGFLATATAKAALVTWVSSLDENQAGQLTAGTANPDGDPALPDSSGSGLGIGTYDTITHVFTWNVFITGLGSPATLAHFHFGAPGVFRGPVRIETPTLDIGTLAGATDGSFSGSLDFDDPFTPGVPAGGVAQLQSELLAGNWYLNIHTQNFGAGEIRGQVFSIYEPATALLLGLGFVGMWRGRRRLR